MPKVLIQNPKLQKEKVRGCHQINYSKLLVRARTHVCICVYVCVYARVHVSVFMHTLIHMCEFGHVYATEHTQPQSEASPTQRSVPSTVPGMGSLFSGPLLCAPGQR